jgi:molybdenum cofactor synthesis domain-containing protein
MRPFTHTLPFTEALRIVTETAVPVARVERVRLADADERVAARDISSTIDVPPFDRAVMDGYAVRAADTTGATAEAPRALVCVGRVFAGDAIASVLRSNECLEIATGAPLPAGADAVVMVEDTAREGERSVLIRTAVMPRTNVGPRGGDIAAGAVVVSAGQALVPSRIGAIAATGANAVDVYVKPTVAILSTGDELVEAGKPLGPGQIYEINRFTLAAVTRKHGGVPMLMPSAPDSIDRLTQAIDEAAKHDLIVFSGGSSVGDRDLVRDVIATRGEMFFHGIAVKPGKPTAFARVGNALFLGMPGNPTSCLSNAYMLLVPLLRRMARLPVWSPRVITAPLARRIVCTAGRHQFFTVRIVDGRVEPAFTSSGHITSMAHADGYIEIPATESTVEAGTMVTVTIF